MYARIPLGAIHVHVILVICLHLTVGCVTVRQCSALRPALDLNCILTKSSDVDECSTANGNCTQNCINTGGSYHCVCNPGYQLEYNNRTCKGQFKQKS